METNDTEFFYSDDANNAILAYLDHVNRKLKKDPDYDMHPIIKAINLALIADENSDGRFIGVAGSKVENERMKPTEMYSVAVEKNGEIFKILDIMDLTTGNTLSMYEALLIIELSLKLEKIKSNVLKPCDIERLLNETFNDIKFEVISPDNFEKARDYFKEMLVQGKIHIPLNEDLICSFTKITATTPWEEYDPRVRGIISSIWTSREGRHAVSLDSNEIPKEKVIKILKNCITGTARDYMFKNLQKTN
jgi:hypothetical protein